MQCPDCYGSGSIPPGAVDISDYVPCPTCDGSGIFPENRPVNHIGYIRGTGVKIRFTLSPEEQQHFRYVRGLITAEELGVDNCPKTTERMWRLAEALKWA